jgi:hypothetical protein
MDDHKPGNSELRIPVILLLKNYFMSLNLGKELLKNYLTSLKPCCGILQNYGTVQNLCHLLLKNYEVIKNKNFVTCNSLL